MPNLVLIGPAVWDLSYIFEFVTPYPFPNAPWGLEPINLFSLCPFPDESAYVCRIWSRSVQLFGIFPTFLNFWPPTNAPWCLEGLLFFNLHQFRDESAYVCQIWSRSVQWFGIFPRFVTFLPHKPPKMPPGLSWGQFFLGRNHSQIYPHMRAKFGHDRSSRLAAYTWQTHAHRICII